MKSGYYALFVEYRGEGGRRIADWVITQTRDGAIGALKKGGIDFEQVYYESGRTCATYSEAVTFISGERYISNLMCTD